ncbi:MAG TPA: cyclopropane-fatty-acyl-phospholipid synthase family protein [Thermoanaerobaculia bacterium]|nr:cyclopropane-fatty-acyl-phospholipid synthase family protein [Thermoanaerobaculia bacterium]
MLDRLLIRGFIPDAIVRFGIRRFLKQRLTEQSRGGSEQVALRRTEYLAMLRDSPLAVATDAANEQHYEVPASFFRLVLGKNMKYSSALWPDGTAGLDDAEDAMLALTCQRAALIDGQEVLELGCGWGSLTLWIASQYPASRITAVSNSASQKVFIDGEAKRRGLHNVEVITTDMRDFDIQRRFDRVVSVEMFEHMRNHQLLLRRVSKWLAPGGRLFVHIFTHREHAYLFEDEGSSDWMARHFFTGGMMPSHDLLLEFNDALVAEETWQLPGAHYGRTAEAWLEKMDTHEAEVREIFRATYGAASEQRWWVYWRIFFMSCAELWNFRNGSEWIVSHYRFRHV